MRSTSHRIVTPGSWWSPPGSCTTRPWTTKRRGTTPPSGRPRASGCSRSWSPSGAGLPDGAGRPPGRPRSRRLRARAGVSRCGPPPHGPSPALRAAVRTPRRHRSPCAADQPVPGGGRSRRRRRRGSCLALGWLAHDLTLVPTDRASWPSRRTPRRDVLAVHHTKLRRITAPGPPSGGRHGADHHPLGRTGVPE